MENMEQQADSSRQIESIPFPFHPVAFEHEDIERFAMEEQGEQSRRCHAQGKCVISESLFSNCEDAHLSEEELCLLNEDERFEMAKMLSQEVTVKRCIPNSQLFQLFSRFLVDSSSLNLYKTAHEQPTLTCIMICKPQN